MKTLITGSIEKKLCGWYLNPADRCSILALSIDHFKVHELELAR
jgi:hypothetical protein